MCSHDYIRTSLPSPPATPATPPTCRYLESCPRYSEMTLDANAVDCEGCPAYEPPAETVRRAARALGRLRIVSRDVRSGGG